MRDATQAALSFIRDLFLGREYNAETHDLYVNHCIRVATPFLGRSNTLVVAALLHDVVEDTCVSLETIQAVFGMSVFILVNALTRKPDETYFDYIHRVRKSGEARLIKLVDLADNMSHLSELKDLERATKLRTRYEKAIRILLTPDEEFIDSLKVVIVT